MCAKRQTTVWQRSSRCASNACVEVAKVSTDRSANRIHVRDSKDPRSPELAFGAAAWHCFIEGIKSGDLDRR